MGKPHPTWVSFEKRLRDRFPLDKPVTIEFVPNMPEFGIAHFKDDCYLIQLRLTKQLWIMKECLMHEWAHLRVGWGGRGSCHTNVWGKEYARIYRYMIDKVV